MEKKPSLHGSPSCQTSKLLKSLPTVILEKHFSTNETEQMYRCIQDLHHHNKPEELNEFFKELGVDKDFWLSLDSPTEKTNYVLKALDKNIEENLKKINSQSSNTVVCSNSTRKLKTKGNDFDWLHLKTKNEMLKGKLKTKLVQTINEFNNEKKLRETIGKQLEQNEKIHLEEENYEQVQTEKMEYEWTVEDEQLFLTNIQKLKDKFITTEFLKHCNRFKFISNKELATLASEEISRKLDKTNKAFLSREFLLDKYFSTKENLTENQMKFILKTSPLLGKCVDKAFIKAAILNISYDDLDRMQLQIAEEIITKFETIRNLVRQSRKAYKQSKNLKAKEKIKDFEEKKRKELEKHSKQESFKKHKVKILRKFNYEQKQTQKTIDEVNMFKKVSWPIPLNRAHPSTGLFVKDCNEQCNDDILNQYEKKYLAEMKEDKKQGKATKKDLLQFYTGGPNEKANSYFVKKKQLLMICEVFKRSFYRKEIGSKLQSYEIEPDIVVTDRKTCKSIMYESIDYLARKTTKRIEETEKIMKDKIIENNQKAKAEVYLNKLLTSAVENTFLSFKALGAKFTPSQINKKDKKGNTALYYAVKHKNLDFAEYILGFKADVNIKCVKGMTPLHKAFQTSNYSLICKCLTGYHQPDLNVLDDEGKTPLAYCGRKILELLNLENGVVSVEGSSPRFDNNRLLQKEKFDQVKEQQLEIKVSLAKKV